MLAEKLVVLKVVGFAPQRGGPDAAQLLFSTDESAGAVSQATAPACKADR